MNADERGSDKRQLSSFICVHVRASAFICGYESAVSAHRLGGRSLDGIARCGRRAEGPRPTRDAAVAGDDAEEVVISQVDVDGAAAALVVEVDRAVRAIVRVEQPGV